MYLWPLEVVQVLMQLQTSMAMFGQPGNALSELELPCAFFAPAVHPIEGEHMHRSPAESFVLEPTLCNPFEAEDFFFLT